MDESPGESLSGRWLQQKPPQPRLPPKLPWARRSLPSGPCGSRSWDTGLCRLPCGGGGAAVQRGPEKFSGSTRPGGAVSQSLKSYKVKLRHLPRMRTSAALPICSFARAGFCLAAASRAWGPAPLRDPPPRPGVGAAASPRSSCGQAAGPGPARSCPGTEEGTARANSPPQPPGASPFPGTSGSPGPSTGWSRAGRVRGEYRQTFLIMLFCTEFPPTARKFGGWEVWPGSASGHRTPAAKGHGSPTALSSRRVKPLRGPMFGPK